MRRVARAALTGVILSIATASRLLGQADIGSNQKPRSFEVASIKAGVPADVPGGIRPVTAGGQFRAVLTVRDLIRIAYGSPLALLSSQIAGGPAWVNEERFEITAKAEALAGASNNGQDLLRAMLRALLDDRFHLQLQRERRQMPIFNLLLDRRDGTLGAHLRRANGQCISMVAASPAASDPGRRCGFTRFSSTAISAAGMTLDAFASGISTRPDIERVIRNRTGLSGEFDLDLEYTPALAGDGATGGADTRPDLFTALKEQLGLRLQNATGPVDVFVISRVEKPTPD